MKKETGMQLKELKLLAKKNGGLLDPKQVVAFARDVKTALHTAFEWDNTKAAEQYRLDQARRLIRVSVEVVRHKGKNITVQAFYSVDDDRKDGAGYRSFSVLMMEEEGRESVLRTAIKELKSFQSKYKMLTELSKVFEVISSL